MLRTKYIYSGSNYLDNFNINYKPFNIDKCLLPDVSIRIKGENPSTSIPEQGKFQNHTEKRGFLFLTRVMWQKYINI